MADDTEIVVGSLIACSLIRGCEFVTEKETKTLRVGEKSTSGKEDSTENATLYCRSLLLRKW